MRAHRNDDFISEIYSDARIRAIVSNVLLYKGVRKQDVEDCFEDVIAVALNKDEELSKHPNIHAWLTLTARNVADKYLAKQSLIESNTAEIPEGVEVAAPEKFEEKIEFAERERELLDFLKSNLTWSDYELYTLKIVESRSNAEIATLLNKKQETINKRVTRLKEKLRNIL